MTAREQGFLLLTAHLGDPDRKPLTIPQFRELTLRVKSMSQPKTDRDLSEEDLVGLGYSREMAGRILQLLSHAEQLHWYLKEGMRSGCIPITRISQLYPQRLRKRLMLDAPGVLWAKGDLDILALPAISLVGSRDLNEANRAFAEQVGQQAAKQGYVLVSGNARGADSVAQESCLAHHGKVISVVCDELDKCCVRENVLYLSEDGFDRAFSAQRALQRNRIIHSLGDKTFVAQCASGRGGTWDGARNNLRFGWSPVFCFDDGSAASSELVQIGATAVSEKALLNIDALQPNMRNLFDR